MHKPKIIRDLATSNILRTATISPRREAKFVREHSVHGAEETDRGGKTKERAGRGRKL